MNLSSLIPETIFRLNTQLPPRDGKASISVVTRPLYCTAVRAELQRDLLVKLGGFSAGMPMEHQGMEGVSWC